MAGTITKEQFVQIGKDMRDAIPDGFERAAAMLSGLERLGIEVSSPPTSEEFCRRYGWHGTNLCTCPGEDVSQ